jgi:hypothetical protein
VRRAGALLAATALIVGCGGGGDAEREDPFTEIERSFEAPDPSRHAAPRWARLAVFEGRGAQVETVRVDRRAIQWRVRWECAGEGLSIAVTPKPSGPSRASGACEGEAPASFIGTGSRKLAVQASGRWRLVVDQQLDTPADEPPLSGMTAERTIARGRFRPVERTGRGTATLFELPSGRLALRFEDFVTEANSDLFVWLSRGRAPRTTRQALARPHRTIAALTATVGDQNYLLPRSVRRDDVRSVVIWCRPVRIAYTAAPLTG